MPAVRHGNTEPAVGLIAVSGDWVVLPVKGSFNGCCPPLADAAAGLPADRATPAGAAPLVSMPVPNASTPTSASPPMSRRVLTSLPPCSPATPPTPDDDGASPGHGA